MKIHTGRLGDELLDHTTAKPQESGWVVVQPASRGIDLLVRVPRGGLMQVTTPHFGQGKANSPQIFKRKFAAVKIVEALFANGNQSFKIVTLAEYEAMDRIFEAGVR